MRTLNKTIGAWWGEPEQQQQQARDASETATAAAAAAAATATATAGAAIVAAVFLPFGKRERNPCMRTCWRRRRHRHQRPHCRARLRGLRLLCPQAAAVELAA